MEWATVGLVLGLMALGAVLVVWPLSLMLQERDREIERLQTKLSASKELLQTERTLDGARDLPPADELGVLFGDRPTEGADALGEPAPRPDAVEGA